MKPIYFDNAATSWPKPPAMMEAMQRFNDTIGGNPGRSGHSLSVEAGRVVYEARERVATLFGADDPLSIVFTKNATEALNLALFGLLKPGDHVVTSGMEHNSVMRPLRFLEGQGVEVSVVPCSPTGELDPDDVKRHMDLNTRVVVMTHASNVTGTVLPVQQCAEIAHDQGCLFIVDASQTAGQLPVHVESVGADILCFTGHKALLGPQGTGGLYICPGVEGLLKPLMHGGTGSRSEFEEQPDFLPDMLEAGTPNAIGLAGLSAGVGFLLDQGVETVREREEGLMARFLEGLTALEGATLYGPSDVRRRTAVISFNIEGLSPSDVAFVLDEEYAILSRPGLHCAPVAHRTLGTFPEGAVRFSFGAFTTEDEITLGLEALTDLGRQARQNTTRRSSCPK
jgi:cysteine desulfurase family protein